MKRRRNPYTNRFYCKATPHKARYLKAVFAREVGARQIAKTGTPLFIYRCPTCDGWHLTRRSDGPGAVRIETTKGTTDGIG